MLRMISDAPHFGTSKFLDLMQDAGADVKQGRRQLLPTFDKTTHVLELPWYTLYIAVWKMDVLT